MTNQFISPNWHVLFIHYPIAFLSAGIVIEILTLLWPRGLLRAAGRWMLLLGALLTLPALMAGVYAFRQTVEPSAAQPHLIPWHEVVSHSRWNDDQWHFMRWHILLNSIATAAVVIAVTLWVAATDAWRRKLYLPVLLLLIGGMGAFSVGAWFGGESIYRYGTAVALPPGGYSGRHGTMGLAWYLPPLELHIVLAGILVAIAVGALGLTLRRLEPPAAATEPGEEIGPRDDMIEQTVPPASPASGAPLPPGAYVVRDLFAGRFWLIALIAALCTVVAGLWSVVHVFAAETLKENLQMLKEPDHRRLLLHVIFGVLLVVLTLLLAIFARWGRRSRRTTGGLILLLLLVTAFQLWLGIAMLYDGHEGPIFRFTSASSEHVGRDG